MEHDSHSETIEQRIRKAQSQLSNVYGADRHALRRKINRIRHLKFSPHDFKNFEHRLTRLEQEIQTSVQQRAWRRRHRPAVLYPNSDLPILPKKEEIIAAIRRHPVIIISGDTGSGKTTQIPKFCLEASRGLDGIIGCTQPRRIAATTVARRIAEELDQTLGDTVGYKIRFRDRTSINGFVKIMTDGILLAELQRDPFLNDYDTLIVDEAHERSLNIDLSLGIIKRLISRRKNLKLIITSATIDTEKFSKAFDDAPIIEVSGRMYPVEIRYESPGPRAEPADLSPVELAVEAAERLVKQSRDGDILIFMPTEQDIRDTCRSLEGVCGSGTTVLPLFARLSGPEQSKVFARFPGRKIIVATNVAETSLTIPGIKYVVDTGLARISRYTPRSRCTLLPIESISRSSADQRKGRCGRVTDGVCVRLYSEEDYLSRPMFTPPEILRANLAHVILQMVALKLGDMAEFPFIDSPSPKSIQDGYQLLLELGAIIQAHRKNNNDRRVYRLTTDGRMMARLPVDPRLSRILIEAGRQGCLPEIVVIAAALSIQDPRERPLEMQEAADQAHAAWIDKRSDFISLVNLWRWYQAELATGIGTRKIKRLCQKHFVSYRRMREWKDIHQQLCTILKESGTSVRPLPDADILADTPAGDFSPHYSALHRSILSGFLSNIACKKEKNMYMGAKGREAMVFPGSGLFNRAGKWIVAAEMVLTSRLFARVVARIDPGWLEALGKDRCRYSYSDPHWDRHKETVMAFEQVSLFGLVIVSRRPVVYGRIETEKACDIFIDDALVPADLRQPFAFIHHNQTLIDEVISMESRLRCRDLFVGTEVVADFYRCHLTDVWNVRLLNKKIKAAGGDAFLQMPKEALMRFHPEESLLAGYPDMVHLGESRYPCSYIYDPGNPADGVTVEIPAGAAATVPVGAPDWLVPGLIGEKIKDLVKGLPKTYRRRLGPMPQAVEKIVTKIPCETDRQPLINVLGGVIHQCFGIHIPAFNWAPGALPDHLKMRIVIVDTGGREIASSRNPAILRQDFVAPDDSKRMHNYKKVWERTNITQWDFEGVAKSIDLPPQDNADGTRQNGDTPGVAYPGLTAEPARPGQPETVSLRLFSSYAQAIQAHPKGVKQLAILQLSKEVKHLKRTLKVPKAVRSKTSLFGGPATVELQLFEKVLSAQFAKNIRTQKVFFAHLNAAAQQLYQGGQTLLGAVVPILNAFHHTHTRLAEWQSRYIANISLNRFIDRRFDDLNRLIPENFIALYDVNRLNDLPYYIEAIAIRAQRGAVNLNKDQHKAEKVRFFSDQLDDALNRLSPTTSSMKREAVETFFWLLEAYKVSVFAQELKIPHPVSAKRLKELLLESERMV